MTALLYKPTSDRLSGWLRIRGRRGRDTDPRIIWLHGRTADALQAVVPDWTEPVFDQVTSSGAQVISLDAYLESWGNAAGVNEVLARHNELLVISGQAAGPITVMGYSMGSILAVNFAARYPAKVARLVLVAPVMDLDLLYQGGGSIASGIDGAYGGNWAVNGKAAGWDPVDQVADVAGIPVEIHYGSDDTVIPTSAIAPWAAEHGDTEVTVYSGANHVSIIQALNPLALAASAT